MRFDDQKILEDCYKRQKERRVSRGGKVVSLKPDIKRMKTDKLYRPPPTSSYNHVFSSRLFSAQREPLTQARMQKKFNLLEETVDIVDVPVSPLRPLKGGEMGLPGLEEKDTGFDDLPDLIDEDGTIHFNLPDVAGLIKEDEDEDEEVVGNMGDIQVVVRDADEPFTDQLLPDETVTPQMLLDLLKKEDEDLPEDEARIVDVAGVITPRQAEAIRKEETAKRKRRTKKEMEEARRKVEIQKGKQRTIQQSFSRAEKVKRKKETEARLKQLENAVSDEDKQEKKILKGHLETLTNELADL